MTGYGTGQGTAEGIQTAVSGFNKADDIKQNREAMRQKAEVHTLNIQTQQAQLGMMKTQQTEADIKLQELERRLALRDSHDAMRLYEIDKDVTHLNRAIQLNPMLKAMNEAIKKQAEK